jgi:hypothetical protein
MLCFLLPAPPLAAQFGRGGARAVALAHAVAALDSQSASTGNPAAIATARNLRVVLSSGRQYGISELSGFAISAIAPFRRHVLGLEVERFGLRLFGLYRMQATLAVPLSGKERLDGSIGLSVEQFLFTIPAYGRYRSLGVSLGTQIQLTPALRFGVAASNVLLSGWNDANPLPSSLVAGISATANAKTSLLLAVEKPLRLPISVASAIERQLVDALVLRAGIRTEPVRFATGFGLRTGSILVDIGADRHQRLGWSAVLTLTLIL